MSIVSGILLCAACGDDEDPVDGGTADVGIIEGACGGGTVDDYCRRANCPDSPEAAVEKICRGENFRGYHIESNQCGGKTVHHIIALSHTQYHFDADGKLVGVVQVGDTPAQGCTDHFTRYGRACTGTKPPPRTGCQDADGGSDAL